MCLSIDDTFESIKSKLTIFVVFVVILIIVIVAVKYGTDSTEEDYYDYGAIVNVTEEA